MVQEGKESLEDEECSGRPPEADNGQLGAVPEADPLTTKQEVAEELNADHSTVIWHVKQIGKVKKLGKWEPREQVLENTLEGPLDSKEIKPVNSKGNQP